MEKLIIQELGITIKGEYLSENLPIFRFKENYNFDKDKIYNVELHLAKPQYQVPPNKYKAKLCNNCGNEMEFCFKLYSAVVDSDFNL